MCELEEILTPEQITMVKENLIDVMRDGFGDVIIRIKKGKLRYVGQTNIINFPKLEVEILTKRMRDYLKHKQFSNEP